MGSVSKSGCIADRHSGKNTNGLRVRAAAHLGHVAYKIHFFIHIRVWAKLHDTGSRDYNRRSGRGAGFAWNDIPTMC